MKDSDQLIVLILLILSAFPLFTNCESSDHEYILLKGALVGGNFVTADEAITLESNISIPADIDPETGITTFPAPMYARFRDTFRERMLQYPLVVPAVNSHFDTCYNFSAAECGRIYMPDVALIFYDYDGRSSGEEEAYRMVGLKFGQVFVGIVDENVIEYYCLAFGPAPKGQDFAVIGDAILQEWANLLSEKKIGKMDH